VINSFGLKLLALALAGETAMFWLFDVWPLAIFYGLCALASAYNAIGANP